MQGLCTHVWEVLQALRSHDERFDAWVNKLDLNRNNKDGPISVIGVGSRKGVDEDDGAGETKAVAEQCRAATCFVRNG